LPTRQQLIDIINGCVKAKRESQKAFYKLYYGFAIGICMRYCHKQDDAIEIVNDGYLKVFKTISNFIPRHENVEASVMGWIKKIMIYTAIDHYRKNTKNYLIDEIVDVHFSLSDRSETSIDSMSYKEIIELVQQLSPTYRTVFNLYVIDGYKHEEIAKHLNISVGTSKSNLAKARANIQKMLKATNLNLYEQRKAI
jgi:RNA polymerase sigma-70 factor (ECF subfamily)